VGAEQDRGGGARITVSKDGPYVVEGEVPLTVEAIQTNRFGESWDWHLVERVDVRPPYRLCRCGGSGEQPFCDDSCETNGFDGTEREQRPYAGTARTFHGPVRDLTDAPRLCASARFCDAQSSVWTLVRLKGPAPARLVDRAVSRCPSGRLVVWPHGRVGSAGDAGGEPDDAATGDGNSPLEPALDPSIALVEDPQNGVSGPVWVRGGIRIVSATGEVYEVRNRVTLCRCGSSRNKPFCDGTHVRTRFSDGLEAHDGG
jgi:CDGSH-type Zn-finger protein